MQVLLDTHTFLWWIDESPKLSDVAIVTADPLIVAYPVETLW